jgi:quercetin dioxygenase-like cupin family protein
VISAGDVLSNPLTGESVRFVRTAGETRGEYVLVELRAGTAAATPAHAHPAQTETLEVVAGVLGVELDGVELEARTGDVLVVEPRRAHRWWNAGGSELVFRCRIRPAFAFESQIETTHRPQGAS